MHPRIRRSAPRRWLAAALLVALACTEASREAPSDPNPTASPSSPSSSPTPPSPPPDALGDPDASSIKLTSAPGGSFLVRGRYPFAPSSCRDPERPSLTGRFPGTLRARRADDGTISLTVTLSFDRYLEGIAEVPPSWPAAALDAQAIAARSYALATTGWSGEEGDTLDQPICATTSCQVYRGIPVPPDPTHRRWIRAVRRTDGEVLLDGGRPATTVYFSTSNGRTYSNEDVFGSAPLSYLRPVTERDDGASPTSRWRVRLPFGDLTAFLRAAGRWPSGRSIARATTSDYTLTVQGGGTTRSLGAEDLRDAVNIWAPCLRPRHYPTEEGGYQLPLTVPSRWLQVSAADGAVVVTGRGWGHGAGMVQWGAFGKARRGWSAAEILSFYYGGLRPEDHPEPGLIHVLIASGLTGLRIRSHPGASLDGEPLEPGLVVITGGDRLLVRG
jgi:stage II sporulation protein D